MKVKAIAILDLGVRENDKEWDVAAHQIATVDDPEPISVFWRRPIMAALIHHAEAGYILYDCGCHPEDVNDRLPEEARELFPLSVSPEQTLPAQLKLLGLSVEDLSCVILSHTHFCHMGGLGYLSGTQAGRRVFVSHADFEEGLLKAHQLAGGYQDRYLRANFELPGIEYQLVEKDAELFPGIHAVLLPGHTPGVLGLRLSMESGREYILCSDAAKCHENSGEAPQCPGGTPDTLGFFASAAKLMELRDEHDATILFPHDMEQFEALPKAPDWML